MKFRELPVAKVTIVALVVLFCLVPAMVSETAGGNSPPTGDNCTMRCWGMWHQCLGQCNTPHADLDCRSICWWNYQFCLYRCGTNPRGETSTNEIFDDTLMCSEPSSTTVFQ